MPRRSKPFEWDSIYYKCGRCGSIYASVECEGEDMEAAPTCQYCARKLGVYIAAMQMERCPSPYTPPADMGVTVPTVPTVPTEGATDGR